MTLLSFADLMPPSLAAQGGQRLPSYFNIQRDNSGLFVEVHFSGQREGLPSHESDRQWL